MSIRELFSIYQSNVDSPVNFDDFLLNVWQYMDAILTLSLPSSLDFDSTKPVFAGLSLSQCYEVYNY